MLATKAFLVIISLTMCVNQLVEARGWKNRRERNAYLDNPAVAYRSDEGPEVRRQGLAAPLAGPLAGRYAYAERGLNFDAARAAPAKIADENERSYYKRTPEVKRNDEERHEKRYGYRAIGRRGVRNGAAPAPVVRAEPAPAQVAAPVAVNRGWGKVDKRYGY